MKGEIPRNSYLAQWRRREGEGENSCILISPTRFNPYRPFYSKVDVSCKKNGVLDYSCFPRVPISSLVGSDVSPREGPRYSNKCVHCASKGHKDYHSVSQL